MSTLLPFPPAPPINPLLVEIEKKVRLAMDGPLIYPGKSIQWAARKMRIPVAHLETIEAGLMGLPKSDLDSPGLYALGEKIGAEVRR